MNGIKITLLLTKILILTEEIWLFILVNVDMVRYFSGSVIWFILNKIKSFLSSVKKN